MSISHLQLPSWRAQRAIFTENRQFGDQNSKILLPRRGGTHRFLGPLAQKWVHDFLMKVFLQVQALISFRGRSWGVGQPLFRPSGRSPDTVCRRRGAPAPSPPQAPRNFAEIVSYGVR